jgi:hypothetical protein
MVRDWVESGDSRDECGVLFELEGVSLLPMFRRACRGFVLVRGAGVLAALTPLRVRCVSPVGQKRARVLLSGVVAGEYVLGSLGKRIGSSRNEFQMASAEYFQGVALFFKGETDAAAGAWKRAAMYVHVESMVALGESIWKGREAPAGLQ